MPSSNSPISGISSCLISASDISFFEEIYYENRLATNSYFFCAGNLWINRDFSRNWLAVAKLNPKRILNFRSLTRGFLSRFSHFRQLNNQLFIIAARVNIINFKIYMRKFWKPGGVSFSGQEVIQETQFLDAQASAMNPHQFVRVAELTRCFECSYLPKVLEIMVEECLF